MRQFSETALEIVKGDSSCAEKIAQFQIDMAMESEGLLLDYERLLKGVKAVFDDEAKGCYMVAKMAGTVVGSLMVTREWSDWNCCWYWWIQSVYVLPEYRRRGIYKAMYDKVQEMAVAEGVSQIRLYVDKENISAQSVYQKLEMEECHYCMYEKRL